MAPMVGQNKRTSLFLMANLGAEVSRLLSAKDNQDFSSMEESLVRADQIIKDIEAMKDMETRIAEIEMLSNVVHEMAKPNSTLTVSPQNLKSYFIPFISRLAVVNSL